ncbi:MAG: lysine--tRNA ligase [Chloroflexi bacterium]|nr:lysine--tRNA ligase [Chloroflexota bacterium]
MPGELDELTQARVRKLDALREMGVDPFPKKYERSHLSGELIQHFEEIEGTTVRVAGRLVGAIRDLGGSGFAHILDASGRIQVLFRRNTLGAEGFSVYRLLDAGDFVGVAGKAMRTRTGEITVEAAELTFLSKAIRPLPEKWHGLTDVEKRHRQRYLDLIASEDVRRVFALRSRAVSAIRRFLDGRGFLEVETPILQTLAAGAAARPFETFSNALDASLYLRIAIELHLKRAVVGGIERVYEIGRVFRNEGVDRQHNPEFTMMELYQAYADYEDIMELVESLVSSVAVELLGTTRVQWGNDEIDLAPPWPRRTLRELMIELAGVDYAAYGDDGALIAAARAAGLNPEDTWNRAKLIDELKSSLVDPKLVQPCFVVDYPAETTPLAKRKSSESLLVERFEAFIGGMEIGDAFSELNDPIEQRRRMEDQAALGAEGDPGAQALDEDFLEALEHGMPPTGGVGIGIDRLVMVLANQPNIREVILFPLLRPRVGG